MQICSSRSLVAASELPNWDAASDDLSLGNWNCGWISYTRRNRSIAYFNSLTQKYVFYYLKLFFKYYAKVIVVASVATSWRYRKRSSTIRFCPSILFKIDAYRPRLCVDHTCCIYAWGRVIRVLYTRRYIMDNMESLYRTLFFFVYLFDTAGNDFLSCSDTSVILFNILPQCRCESLKVLFAGFLTCAHCIFCQLIFDFYLMLNEISPYYYISVVNKWFKDRISIDVERYMQSAELMIELV